MKIREGVIEGKRERSRRGVEIIILEGFDAKKIND